MECIESVDTAFCTLRNDHVPWYIQSCPMIRSAAFEAGARFQNGLLILPQLLQGVYMLSMRLRLQTLTTYLGKCCWCGCGCAQGQVAAQYASAKLPYYLAKHRHIVRCCREIRDCPGSQNHGCLKTMEERFGTFTPSPLARETRLECMKSDTSSLHLDAYLMSASTLPTN